MITPYPIHDPDNGTILVGGAGPEHDRPQYLRLDHANRHGLIAGATGTGKTVSLQILAEGLSMAGVPVFVADIKGDMGGIAEAGSPDLPLHEAFASRAQTIGINLDYAKLPVTFWDIHGESGHPVRTTPAEMGPLLLSRILDLSEAQEGVLNIAFRLADDEGMALLDMDDLTSMLQWVGQNARELSLRYGNVSAASIGAIQRRLLVLENQGGRNLFGEPALALSDLMRCDAQGRGMINMLSAERLMTTPRLYASFLLWLMSELFEQLPEVGDPEKPVLAFFFDEAHLLFRDAPPALVQRIEQVTRLIRSKGVSLWFITQNPDDLPDTVLGQLGNRIQHALRAFTPKDNKALRDAARNYRPNPEFDTAQAIQEVGTGEAVTSFLERKGVPGVSQRTLIRPPFTRLGALEPKARAAIIAASPMESRYRETLNRVSAHETLLRRLDQAAGAGSFDADDAAPVAAGPNSSRAGRGQRYQPGGPAGHADPAPDRAAAKPARRRSDTILETYGKSLARQLGTQTGRAINRGILGGLFRRR